MADYDVGWRELIFAPTLLLVVVLWIVAPTPGVFILGAVILVVVAVVLYPLGLGIHDAIRGLVGGGRGGG